MTQREKNLESILKHILARHFYSTELKWCSKEGTSLKEIDFELYLQIANELPEVILYHK